MCIQVPKMEELAPRGQMVAEWLESLLGHQATPVGVTATPVPHSLWHVQTERHAFAESRVAALNRQCTTCVWRLRLCGTMCCVQLRARRLDGFPQCIDC